jgi:hypothetical protein
MINQILIIELHFQKVTIFVKFFLFHNSIFVGK